MPKHKNHYRRFSFGRRKQDWNQQAYKSFPSFKPCPTIDGRVTNTERLSEDIESIVRHSDNAREWLEEQISNLQKDGNGYFILPIKKENIDIPA